MNNQMSNQQNKNYGLNLALEKQQQSEKDWVFGATSPICLAEGMPETEREKYLPKGEVQQGVEDMADCASRGPINILETKFNYLIQNKIISVGSIKFLKDNGYADKGGRVEFSDAFIAINSGTTKQGNSMKAPLESIRLMGLVPKKLLPLEKWMTWDDYHKPERITSELKTLGLEFLNHFGINYEKVYEKNLTTLLNRDLSNLAGFAWSDPVGGEYPRVDFPPNHVFMGLRNPRTYIFDNYIDLVDEDFIKKLAPDYDFVDYGYRIIISEKKKEEKSEKELSFWQKKLNHFIADLLAEIKEIFNF